MAVKMPRDGIPCQVTTIKANVVNSDKFPPKVRDPESPLVKTWSCINHQQTVHNRREWKYSRKGVRTSPCKLQI